MSYLNKLQKHLELNKSVSTMITDINAVEDVDEILGMYDAYKNAKTLTGLNKSSGINPTYLRRYHLLGKILEQKIFERKELKLKHNQSRNMELRMLRSRSATSDNALQTIREIARVAGKRSKTQKNRK